MFCLRHNKLIRIRSIGANHALITTDARSEICRKIGVSEDRVILSIAEMRERRKQLSNKGTVGFVPTMGALHAGHLSLLQTSVSENDNTVSSLFVNNAQFAPHEDFNKYPRTLESDLSGLFAAGCDSVFVPTTKVMYPRASPDATSTAVQSTFVVPFGVDDRPDQEGHARPGFFRGVATVVCKLFNIIGPDTAYFGQKDGLQTIVVRQMVHDLNMPIKVAVCPTIREGDGLAMSSRNRYLNEDQRAVAPTLYQSLLAGKRSFSDGSLSTYSQVRDLVISELSKQSEMYSVEYVSICDFHTAEELVDQVLDSNQTMMISAAVNFGNCRILDNVLIGAELQR